MRNEERTEFSRQIPAPAYSDLLRLSQTPLADALANAGMAIWSFDLAQNTAVIGTGSAMLDGDAHLALTDDASLTAHGLLPESLSAFHRLVHQMKRGQRSAESELSLRPLSEDGAPRWVLLRCTVQTDADGAPVSAYGIEQDVTERRATENAYEHTVRAMPTLYPDIITCLQIDLTQDDYYMLAGSSFFAALFAKHRDEANEDPYAAPRSVDGGTRFVSVDGLFKHFARAVTDTPQRLALLSSYSRAGLIHALREDRPIADMTLKCRMPGNRQGWVQLVTRLVRNPYNGHDEALLCITDATERLLEENKLHNAVTDDYDFVAIIDVTTRNLTLRNAKARALVPFTHDGEDYDASMAAFISRFVMEQERNALRKAADLDDVIRRLRVQPTVTLQFTCTDEGGARLNKRFKYNYLDDERSILTLSAVDLTDAVAREQAYLHQVENALDEAKAANAAKSDFLARVSHEIRTPMNAIIGLTALARDEADNAAHVIEELDKINAASHFLLSLINDVLDMSRIERGKFELHPVTKHLTELDDFVQTMVAPVCDRFGVKLDFRPCASKYVVSVDDVRFEQMVLNLASNAAKFTPEGGTVSLRLSVVPAGKGTILLQCIVQDNGVGMSADFLKRAFEPFTQENTTPSPKAQGTGLGLAISRSIAQSMNGDLTLESELGKGTKATIRVTLPLCAEETTPAAAAQLSAVTLDGLRLLVVEDHPLNREIVTRLLKKKGVTVVCATNGQEGVSLFEASPVHTFDGILMDFRMPVMNGLDASRAIRALPRADAATVPIIATTANAFSEDIQAARDAGMNAHLSKPIEPKELYRVLGEWCVGRT